MAARKDRINRAVQGVLVCAAVSWPTSERSEMERERERERKQVVELKKVAALTQE